MSAPSEPRSGATPLDFDLQRMRRATQAILDDWCALALAGCGEEGRAAAAHHAAGRAALTHLHLAMKTLAAAETLVAGPAAGVEIGIDRARAALAALTLADGKAEDCDAPCD